MIAAMAETGKPLAINWPLAWYASHVKCHELCRSGAIGEVLEVHYHDGNRGPLWHGADKIEREPSDADKASSWFYRESEGGGSLQDYLGYGTTLATWFNGGRRPIEVMAMWDRADGGALEVDEHSVTVVRYETGLSKFETRWGTLSDPWTEQPEPAAGSSSGEARAPSRAGTTTTTSPCAPVEIPGAKRSPHRPGLSARQSRRLRPRLPRTRPGDRGPPERRRLEDRTGNRRRRRGEREDGLVVGL